MITWWESFDLQTNSFNQFFREMDGDQSGEFVFEYCSLQCLTVWTVITALCSKSWNRLPALFPSLLQWQKHLRHGHQKEQIFLLFHKLMLRSFASLSKMESSRMGYSTTILKSLNRGQSFIQWQDRCDHWNSELTDYLTSKPVTREHVSGHVSGHVTRNSQQLNISLLKTSAHGQRIHSSTELSICGTAQIKTSN